MFLDFFTKKEKIAPETKDISDNLPMLYLSNLTQYTEYMGRINNIKDPNNNEAFFTECAQNYFKYVNYFAEKIKTNYPDNLFFSEETIIINNDNLLVGAPTEAKKLFTGPQEANTIYLKNDSTNIYFCSLNGIIIESVNVHHLPKLSSALANSKLNQLFIGLSLEEGVALLQQMKVLPKKSQAIKLIKTYKEDVLIHRDFMNSIIYLLLLGRSSVSVQRAKVFADNFGINFNFEPFETKNHKSLILKY